MFRDGQSERGISFGTVEGLSESQDTTVKSRSKMTTVFVEGGAQGLLEIFLRTKLDLPNAELEKTERGSRVSMVEKRRGQLLEALSQLPPIFKVTEETEADEAA